MKTIVIYVFHADNDFLGIHKAQKFTGRGWTLQYACDAFVGAKEAAAA